MFRWMNGWTDKYGYYIYPSPFMQSSCLTKANRFFFRDISSISIRNKQPPHLPCVLFWGVFWFYFWFLNKKENCLVEYQDQFFVTLRFISINEFQTSPGTASFQIQATSQAQVQASVSGQDLPSLSLSLSPPLPFSFFFLAKINIKQHTQKRKKSFIPTNPKCELFYRLTYIAGLIAATYLEVHTYIVQKTSIPFVIKDLLTIVWLILLHFEDVFFCHVRWY